MKTFFYSISIGIVLSVASVHAAQMTFSINANGIKEVNAAGNPAGDPDGSATGTLLLDDGSGGTTGFALFNLSLANLDSPFTAHHIHMAPTNTTGAVFLGFGNPEVIRTGNSLVGTVTGLSSSSIDAIMANPGAFYYNLHNNPFPGGAVRDQLAWPSPSNTVTIPWSALRGGGGTSTGLTVRVRGTIGQFAAGRVAGLTAAITGGFWVIVQTPGAPLLTITRTTTNTALISWPSPSTGFTLQQNTNSVASVNWSNVTTTPTDNGTIKFIIVNPPVGNRFYRLFKP